MSQQPKRRRPKPRPRTQQAAVTVPPVTTQPVTAKTGPPATISQGTGTAIAEQAIAPTFAPGGDPHGYLAIGLAAGAFAVVAFLTILAAMAAT